MPQFGWTVDLRRCVGCDACSVACKAEMNTDPVSSPLVIRNGHPVQVNYRAVLTVEGGDYPNVTTVFVTAACNHCASPACLPACPVGAITKDAATGLVQIAAATCVGCRYCEWACPYGAIQFNERSGKVEKCTGCAHRLAENLAPACVATCPTGALQFTRDFRPTTSEPPEGFADPSLTRPSIRFLRP
jgi:anaerobic dimethyl sulfoxide reductase subunit B (iron-sulfur subunit)